LPKAKTQQFDKGKFLIDVTFNDSDFNFGMRYYHVLSMDEIGGKVIDNVAVIDVDDVTWSDR